MPQIGFKSFRQEGCNTYLLWDAATRQAAIIDPVFEAMDTYREFVNEKGLRPAWVLDTHTHADHNSASHVIREAYKSEIGMSAKSQSERPTRRLNHGDVLELGALKITALETPGHTPDAMTFYVEDVGADPIFKGAIFTGDTLLIGGSGRVDFPGADPALQWKSLHETLGKLPGATLVFPGHDYNDILFSTLATEREKNPHLRATAEDFVALKQAEAIANPADEVRRRVAFNIAVSPPIPPAALPGSATQCGSPAVFKEGIAAINVDKYWAKLQSPVPEQDYIDVRETDEFADGHPPGARNIPLAELGFHLREVMQARRVYFSCLSGRRSSFAAKTLAYIGHTDAVNVTGGFKAWLQAGLPVKK